MPIRPKTVIIDGIIYVPKDVIEAEKMVLDIRRNIIAHYKKENKKLVDERNSLKAYAEYLYSCIEGHFKFIQNCDSESGTVLSTINDANRKLWTAIGKKETLDA